MRLSGVEESLWVRFYLASCMMIVNESTAIGGSSSINFYAWVKPPAEDIDAFEKLGNPGWNWADYAEYSRKVETYVFCFIVYMSLFNASVLVI